MITSRCQRALVGISLLFSSGVVSQQVVRIDDTNVYSPTNPNGIQFGVEGWVDSDGSYAVRYNNNGNNTYTYSSTQGSVLVYFFRGTSIAHYGEKSYNHGPIGVSIDGMPYENVTWENAGALQYRQQMWYADNLSRGDHQLVIYNVGTGDSATSIMGVDYFEVTPDEDGEIVPSLSGPGASIVPSNAVLVDDPSNMITYSKSWSMYFSEMYLRGSDHFTRIPGASATFRFHGTAVWYFCHMNNNSAVVKISLDGGEPDIVNTADPASRSLLQHMVWSKADLSESFHTLTITHAGSADTYAHIDFFKYLPSSASSKYKSATIGAIVGGVVGGVVLIAFIVGILMWGRRQRPVQHPTGPAHETHLGEASYGEKQAYAPSTPGTPECVPSLNYQNGMYAPAQNQNAGGSHSIAPTTITGATYVGHPEIY